MNAPFRPANASKSPTNRGIPSASSGDGLDDFEKDLAALMARYRTSVREVPFETRGETRGGEGVEERAPSAEANRRLSSGFGGSNTREFENLFGPSTGGFERMDGEERRRETGFSSRPREEPRIRAWWREQPAFGDCGFGGNRDSELLEGFGRSRSYLDRGFDSSDRRNRSFDDDDLYFELLSVYESLGRILSRVNRRRGLGISPPRIRRRSLSPVRPPVSWNRNREARQMDIDRRGFIELRGGLDSNEDELVEVPVERHASGRASGEKKGPQNHEQPPLPYHFPFAAAVPLSCFSMALNFTQLALHLQLAAVKKLEFKDFSEFLKSSKHTINHFKNVKSRFPLSISWINIMGEGIYIYSENKPQSYDMKWKDWLKAMSNRPVWIECKQLDISVSDNADYAEILSGFVERGFKITKLSLRFPTDTLCNLAVIDDILETLSCKALCLYYYSNQSVTNYNYKPAFSKLKLLQLSGSLTSTLLRAFHTQRLILCGMADTRMGLTEKDLNDYLKAPSAKHLCFRSREGLFADRSDKVLLEGLPHSVLWTTEDHPQSPLSDIPWEWGGRAYIVKSKDSRLLVALAFEFFFCMDKLKGDTEEELKEDAWAYLRKILEKNLVV